MAVQVAAETGGAADMMDGRLTQACGISGLQGLSGFGQHGGSGQISLDRLEEVVRAHRRDGCLACGYKTIFEMMEVGGFTSRTNDGNSAEFKHTETGIEIIPTPRACRPLTP